MAMRDDFAEAYRRRDIKAATALGLRMETLLGQLDTLLTLHPYFSMQRWVDKASAFGTDAADSAYYRRNARTLLTTWGETPQSLNDYASRTWAGLVSHYYHPRWHELICEVLMAMKLNAEFDERLFKKSMCDLEQAAQYPEGRQFYASVLDYMQSRDFAPAASATLDELRQWLSLSADELQLDELNNISPY